jgi:hypothetical protein
LFGRKAGVEATRAGLIGDIKSRQLSGLSSLAGLSGAARSEQVGRLGGALGDISRGYATRYAIPEEDGGTPWGAIGTAVGTVAGAALGSPWLGAQLGGAAGGVAEGAGVAGKSQGAGYRFRSLFK